MCLLPEQATASLANSSHNLDTLSTGGKPSIARTNRENLTVVQLKETRVFQMKNRGFSPKENQMILWHSVLHLNYYFHVEANSS